VPSGLDCRFAIQWSDSYPAKRSDSFNTIGGVIAVVNVIAVNLVETMLVVGATFA
jgi:hypothetical protein